MTSIACPDHPCDDCFSCRVLQVCCLTVPPATSATTAASADNGLDILRAAIAEDIEGLPSLAALVRAACQPVVNPSRFELAPEETYVPTPALPWHLPLVTQPALPPGSSPELHLNQSQKERDHVQRRPGH